MGSRGVRHCRIITPIGRDWAVDLNLHFISHQCLIVIIFQPCSSPELNQMRSMYVLVRSFECAENGQNQDMQQVVFCIRLSFVSVMATVVVNWLVVMLLNVGSWSWFVLWWLLRAVRWCRWGLHCHAGTASVLPHTPTSQLSENTHLGGTSRIIFAYLSGQRQCMWCSTMMP